MQTKFLFFDLGNVLIRFSTERLFEQIGEALGQTPKWVANTLYCPEMLQKAECGQISTEQYYQIICNLLPEREIAFERLLPAVNDIFWLNEPMRPTLRCVAEAGIPRGILSNIGPWHWEHCVKTYPEITQNIPSNHVLSYKVGVMKPNREIYAAAFRFAQDSVPGIEPSEVLFIDDLEENVQGAKDFGFQSVQYSFDEHEKLLDTLKLH